jgi:hypothetical protein
MQVGPGAEGGGEGGEGSRPGEGDGEGEGEGEGGGEGEGEEEEADEDADFGKKKEEALRLVRIISGTNVWGLKLLVHEALSY